MPSQQCEHVLARTGNQCKNRTRNGIYCHSHQHMHPEVITVKPEVAPVKQEIVPPVPVIRTKHDTCPICLDDKELRLFRCNHGTCFDCATQLRNATCALCRSDNTSDFTVEERRGMRRLTRHDREVQIEEERRDLVREVMQLTDDDVRRLVNEMVTTTEVRRRVVM